MTFARGSGDGGNGGPVRIAFDTAALAAWLLGGGGPQWRRAHGVEAVQPGEGAPSVEREEDAHVAVEVRHALSSAPPSCP